MVDNDMPGAWPIWTPGAPLAAFIKESIIHWSTQHMKALGHMVSEKKIFLCFSHDAHRAGPVWTPGAQLAGFIKRTTIHCYTQNMKAVLPMTPPPPPPPGQGTYGPQGHSWQDLHTKYESFGPCGFGEEYFFVFPMTPPGRGQYGPQGHGRQDL